MTNPSYGSQNHIKIKDIRFRLLTGEISYVQAKTEAHPIIAKMNQLGAEISRESGIKYKPISFSSLMR